VEPGIEPNLAVAGTASAVSHAVSPDIPEGDPRIWRPAKTGAVPEGGVFVSIFIAYNDVVCPAVGKGDANSPGTETRGLFILRIDGFDIFHGTIADHDVRSVHLETRSLGPRIASSHTIGDRVGRKIGYSNQRVEENRHAMAIVATTGHVGGRTIFIRQIDAEYGDKTQNGMAHGLDVAAEVGLEVGGAAVGSGDIQ
jgi:hypothetical protein